MSNLESPLPSLEDDRQRLARERILRAGRIALRDIGADATMDDVARLANLARRTLFRYFPTRDELFRDVLLDIVVDYVDALPAPGDFDDLETWLLELSLQVHRANASIGAGYRQLIVGLKPDGPIREALDKRDLARVRLSNDLAAKAWKLDGRKGAPPKTLAPAIGITLGPLATAVLTGEHDQSIDEAAATSAAILTALIRAH